MATPPTFTVGQVLTAAQMNAVGMWKTGSYTFTGQTTAQINNCFTDDFDKYQIVYNLRLGSGAAGINMRLSSGGTPNATAASYVVGGRYVGYPTVGAADFNGAYTEWQFTYTGTFSAALSIIVTDPKAARPTAFTGNAASTNAAVSFAGYHNQSVAYDGIYLFNTGATAMYGTVNIYGFRN